MLRLGLALFPGGIAGLLAAAAISDDTTFSLGIVIVAIGATITGTTFFWKLLEHIKRQNGHQQRQIDECRRSLGLPVDGDHNRPIMPGIPGEE